MDIGQQIQLTPDFSHVSPPDARDHLASLGTVPTLPSSVDLKPSVYEVENQLNYGSCTANAGCSALELMYKQLGKPVDLSRFYLYYYVRQLGGLKGDVGAYPRDIGKALKAYGVCTEAKWDYIPANLEAAPDAAATAEAAGFKIVSYEALLITIPAMQNALAQGIPILLSIQVHQSFFGLTGPWTRHTWDWQTTAANPVKGGHEVLVIGYDDESRHFLVENSWGPAWADGGFFGLPYEMVGSAAFGELWLLTPNPDPSIPVPPEPTPVAPEESLLQKILGSKWLLPALAIGLIYVVYAT